MSKPGLGPILPSNEQIDHKEFSAVEVAQPTDRTKGVDVSRYKRIVFTVHGVNPDIDDAGAIGWQLRVKVWRWKQQAKRGTGRSGGQWFAEEVVTASMDGDVDNGGPMEYELPTWDSELMYFQPFESISTPVGGYTAAIEVYGLVPDECVCGGGAGGSTDSSASRIVQGLFDPLAHDDYTYSSLRGDFSATRASGTTILLTGLDFSVEERQIIAVGLKLGGSATRTRIWYRDKDLRVDYDPANSLITVAGFTINASDEVMVWLEGPSKTNDPTNRSKRSTLINPDAYHLVTDGEFLNLTISAQAAVNYFPFMMAQDGYYWLKTHIIISGDTYAYLEATNDLEEDGSEVWHDVTWEVYGVAQIDADNYLYNLQPQCACGWRRMRWAVADSNAGGTIALYMLRSAYGGNWVPVSHEGLTYLGTGYEAMGHARATQATAIAADTAGTLVTNLYKELVTAAYIWATQAEHTEEDDPIDTRDVVEPIIDVENLADSNWHYVYFRLEHLQHWSIQFIMSDGTATDDLQGMIWASNESGVAPGSIADWADITNLITGLAAVVNTAGAVDDMYFADTSISADWIRVGYQRTAGAANDGDITVRLKMWY